MKKLTIALSVFAGLLVSLSSAQADPLKKGDTLRLASQPGTQYAAFYIAKNQGLFEEEFKKDGFKFTYADFKSGPTMLESFASGGQDIGVIGDTPALIGRSAGIPIKAVSVIGAGPKRIAILVSNKSTAKSIQDLKGLTVGTPKGTPAHQLLNAALSSANLSAAEVKVVNLPYQDAVVALASGDVDAVSLVEPYVSDAEVRNFGRQLVDGSNLILGTSLVISVDTFAKQNPAVVTRVLKVLAKADAWRKNHAAEAAKILNKETKFSEAALARALPKVSSDYELSDAVVTDLRKTAAGLRKDGLLKNEVDPDKLVSGLVDDQYLKALSAKK